MLDYLIENAVVFDGSGNDGKVGRVGILDGKIVLDCTCEEASQVIDAKGMIVAPGFIDVHGHSDLFAFIDPLRASKLCQGITTEIGGQCGLSPAPVSEKHCEEFSGYYRSLGVPIYPNGKELTSVGNLFDELDSLNMGINVALFAAHGTIRIAAMGLDPRPADEEDIKMMGNIARDAVDAGALGLSSGLMYAPGSFASQQELTRICEYLRGTGAIYTSHIRNQGNGLIESVRETLEIANDSGLRANVSHHKAVGPRNWGKVRATTEMIHLAGATSDVYPFEASSTTLTATLPPSFFRQGMEKVIARLSDQSFCHDLEESIIHPSEEFDNDLLECGYDGILIITAAMTPDAIGCTIKQYAQKLGLSPFEAYVKLLLDNKGAVGDVCFSMSKSDVDYLVCDSDCMFGTDSLYVPQAMKMTHPRAIGTFTKILGEYVRDRKMLSMKQAIRRMTGLPADVYGFLSKGYVKEGFDADLVVFNPDRIAANCTYTEPLLPNSGIEYVFVNGKLAVRNGLETGVRAGRVIRHRA
ncbi:MAG: N-acyl-D-amino-acid deacylase family protein [Sphaerochaetaceae bacterium]